MNIYFRSGHYSLPSQQSFQRRVLREKLHHCKACRPEPECLCSLGQETWTGQEGRPRIPDELRKAGENLDKVLAQMDTIPLFKLPTSEKELDMIIQKFTNPTPSQEPENIPVAAPSPSQDRPDSAPQGKKPAKRTRDSEGFISPPKHLTRKAPKDNPNNFVQDVPTPDPDVDVNILDPVVAASPPKIPKLAPLFR
ncbi:hypothetical protein NPIL_114401 [Nephila pilipes]|uniref:Uncharacterized protein n=1 Tax=Nephila pilipes TaxID=299642 RepID=A0A8X6PRF6_NEPPI|nr:hypothetical protein NPIL_114401 [Nephila pilipes]